MNKIILIGNTTKNPETNITTSGKQYCRFNLAVSRKFDKDTTDFFSCVAWEKMAELITKYVKKGNRLGIVGRLEINDTEKDGIKTRHHNIIVEEVDFLTPKTTSNESDISPDNFMKNDDLPF